MNSPLPNLAVELGSAIEAWWGREAEDWDSMVASKPTASAGQSPTSDLWDNIPEVDSKAVARSSPIFEQYLGIPLNIKLIRPGGYSAISDMIADLVPKMIAEQDQHERVAGDET